MTLSLPWRADQLNDWLAWRRTSARRWRQLIAWNATWIAWATLLDGVALVIPGLGPWLRGAFAGIISACLVVGWFLLARAVRERRKLLAEIAEIERFAALPVQARGALSYTRSLAEGNRYPIALTWLARR